jgi:predicted Zn-dependent peptidase
MGTMLFYAEPKEGQSLEEVRDLLLGEIEHLKQGKFTDAQLSAISKNLKLNLEELKENNFSRSWLVIQALSWNMPWENRVNELNQTGDVSRAQVIDFANRVFRNNYAICFKKQGEPQRHKVEKPAITPIETNNQLSSAFKQQLDAEKLPTVTPKFVDFAKDIKLKRLGKLTPYFAVANPLSKKFTLTYVYPVGTLTYPSLNELEDFLELVGTKDYTAEQWKNQLYEKALVLDVSASDVTTTFTITGLDEMLGDGAQMLNHFKTSWKPDAEVLAGLLEDKLAQRRNNLSDKGVINRALASFGYYGAVNPVNKVLSNKQLLQLTIDSMTAVMNRVQSYQPEVVYVGSLSADKAHAIISKHFEEGVVTRQAKSGFPLPELKRDKNEVYFCHFDQKQTQFAFIQNGPAFNPTLMAKIDAFNQYFGSGISSLMYQEIREKQGLAYSSYSSVNEPEWQGQLSKLFTYVGTQADKLPVALSETRKLMTNMPAIDQQWDVAKTLAMKTIETDWLVGGAQYWYYRECRQLGLQEDPRKVMYEDLKNLTLAQMLEFYNKELAKAPYTLTVMGNRKLVPTSLLQQYGTVKELKPEFLLGY